MFILGTGCRPKEGHDLLKLPRPKGDCPPRAGRQAGERHRGSIRGSCADDSILFCTALQFDSFM